MSFVSLSCVGHVEVAQKLTRGAAAVKSAGVPNGLDASGLLVERRAKQIVVEKGIIDTGNLLNSIAVIPASPSVREVLSGAEYSIYNEYGTCKMAARPYMRPALDESSAAIERLLGAAVVTTLVSVF